jgi:hypothetical protein
MSGRNEQRKPGTTRGSPWRSRTAKASRISRFAVKSRCACEWDGWGRISDDGSGHYNPNLSEDPWGGGVISLHGGAQSRPRPDTVRDNRDLPDFPVNLEHILGDIQTDCGNLHVDGSPHVVCLRRTTLWHFDAASGRCPPHQSRTSHVDYSQIDYSQKEGCFHAVGRVAPATALSRRMNFCILPEAVCGNCCTKRQTRGILKDDRCRRQNASSSSVARSTPGRG